MATITLPIWTIGAAIGLPTICLVWLIVSLVRKKRKLRASAQKNDFSGSPPGKRTGWAALLSGFVLDADRCGI